MTTRHRNDPHTPDRERDLRPGLRLIVRQLLDAKGDRTPFGDDEPLLTGGRLESVDVIELVMHLEQAHGVDFSTRAFDPDDFDSVARMEALLQR